MSRPRLEGFSLIEIQVKQWEKDLHREKEAQIPLRDYEERYTRTCESLKELARETIAQWEPAYAELRQSVEQHMSNGAFIEAMEQVEGFLLQTKSALTEYRRKKAQTTLPYRKAPVDLKEYRTKSVRQELGKKVKELQERISNLVTDAKQEATNVLEYLQDIHSEAEKMLGTLQRKVERAAPSIASGEPMELLQAIHHRLVQAGKVRVSYHDFALQLREGTGSFHFAGKQTDLAYLLLFLNKNGLADNWKGLHLSYLKNGVPTKTTAQSIREAQKKFSIRNEPEIKNLLGGMRETFPELAVP